MVSPTVEALAALEDDNDGRASLLIQKVIIKQSHDKEEG